MAGTEFWCQGYSEPGSGSDLASLRTTAEDAGDHFIVNGQKTWTSYAQYADWIFCLVRTDPSAKKQAGITFLLIDLKSPGVEVRIHPARTLLLGLEESGDPICSRRRVGRNRFARGGYTRTASALTPYFACR